MFVKRFLIAWVAAFPFAAYADDTAAQCAQIHGAIQRTAAYTAITITLTGKETLGRRRNDDLRIELFADFSQANSPKVCAREYVNSELRTTLVGDGNTLWHYDATQNSYSTSVYGERVPTGQTKRTYLVSQFRKLTRGHLAHLGQILHDIYGPVQTRWVPFMPAAKYIDAKFWNPSRAKSESMAYGLTSDEHDPVLASMTYSLAEARGADVLRVDWNASFAPGWLPSVNVFEFTPPRSAQPVRRQG